MSGYSRCVAATDRIATDYRALTEACGLIDRSERGKLALTGPGAKEFLDAFHDLPLAFLPALL